MALNSSDNRSGQVAIGRQVRSSTPRLEDLIQLNREISALVNAGIPIEHGLRGLAGSVSSRLGECANRLADRMAGGQSLIEALEQEGASISPVYSAVVSAGLSAGQLGKSLETLANSAQLEFETRRRVWLSLLYPIIVAVLAFGLLSFFVGVIVPQYVRTVEEFRFANSNSVTIVVLKWLHQTQPIWGIFIPSLVFLLGIVYSLSRLRSQATLSAWNYILSLTGVQSSVDLAQFTEVLRLQISSEIPLSTAFRRAAVVFADPKRREAATQISEDLEKGVPLSETRSGWERFPPTMRWMLSTAEKQGTIAESLSILSNSYRQKAISSARQFRIWIPAFVTVFVSGSMVLIYCLIFFVPLADLWSGLASE